MTTDVPCPVCRGGGLVREEGRLEQSGDSYLPTAVWRCACCGYTRWEPAERARWQPAQEQRETASRAPQTLARRRAA